MVMVLVLPTGVEGKLTGLGEKTRAFTSPVPVSVATPSPTRSEAVLLPAVVGLNKTETRQLLPAGNEVSQLVRAIANCEASVPPEQHHHP